MGERIRIGAIVAFLLLAVGGITFLLVQEKGGAPVPATPIAPPVAERPAPPVTESPARHGSAVVLPPAHADISLEELLAGLPQQKAAEGDARIAGTVVDRLGRPLPGMYVTGGGMFSSFIPRTDTDGEGKFVIEKLMPGTHKVMALPANSSGSNIDSGIQEVTLKKGQALTGLRIVYEGACERTISGRVTNTKGDPVEGASVYVDASAHSLHARTKTDAEGRYLLDLRARLKCAVNVTHPEYSGQWLVYTEAGNNDVNFVLEDRGTIAGRVVDARTRAPIIHFEAGSGVRYPNVSEFGAMSMKYMAFDHEEGRFTLESVDVGRVNVYVRAAGYAPARLEFPEVKGATVTEAGEFRLVAGASIEGAVVDREGAPVPGAKIRLGGPRDRAMYPHHGETSGDMIDATTDGEGRFRLDSLDAAFTKITASHPDHPETPAPLTLALGKVTPVRIVMTGLATVEGTVYANGEPAVRGNVSVNADGLKAPKSGEIGEGGFYRVPDVPGGQVTVTATLHVDGSLRSASADAETALGHTTVVDLEVFSGTATIEGTVTQNGEPVAMVSVGANAVDGSDHAGTMTAPDGRYRISGLFGGTYRVAVVDVATGTPAILGTAESTVKAGETAVMDFAADGVLEELSGE